MKTTMTRLLSLLALATSMPAVAVAQERVGVATTVVGPVTVTHVATSPAPLKFKDDVLLNDRVATGDNAFARMLLGGKAIVTARERSIVTITEAPGVSTIDLASGRISVAVDKSRMRPGEVVEIKTPNAVSGIRGTIVVAEVAGDVSTITVLRGLVDVYRRDPASGQAVGSATPVGVRESVTVKANVLPARPQPISVDHARKLAKEFTTPVQPVSPATTITADEVSRAKALIGALTDGQSVTAIPTQIDPLAARTETPTTSGMLPPPTALAPNSPLPTAPIVGAVPTAPLPTAPIVSPLPTTPLPTAPIVSPLPTAPLPTSPIAAPLPTVPKITPTVPTLTVPLPTNSLLK